MRVALFLPLKLYAYFLHDILVCVMFTVRVFELTKKCNRGV